MFRSLIAAFVLVVIAAGAAGSNIVQAQDQPKDKPAKVADKKPADNDGVSLATCEHPVDKEEKKVQVRRHFRDQDGTIKERVDPGVVTDEVALSGPCAQSSPTSTTSGFAVTSAYSMSWLCYGKQELNTLLGNNWRLEGWQYYSTNSYYGNITPWPPSFPPLLKPSTGLGWSTTSTHITGPGVWYSINGFPYKGATVFQALFEYKIGALGFTVTLDSDSPMFRLTWGHNYCAKTTL